MNLIDRDILVGKDGLFGQRGCPGRCAACNLWSEDGCRVILETPIVDARPVIHAKWRIESDEEEPNPMFKLVVCSACNEKANDMYQFCPNCGATMDLESEEEE